MSRAEGLRRVGTVIRVAGLVWLASFSVAAVVNISQAVNDAAAAQATQSAIQARLAKLSDDELIALSETLDPNTHPLDTSPWHSQHPARSGFGFAIIGAVGVLVAFAFAWILDGFASPAKS